MTHAAAQSATLARYERLSRDELTALKLAKLKRQLERAYATNPFYRARFDDAGIVPDDIASLDDFRRRLPAVTKADFLRDQDEHPPFGRRLGVARDRVVLVTLTGGTSGQGQEVYGRTAADAKVQAHLHFLPYYTAGLRPGDVVFNCAPSGGLATGGWGPPDGFRLAGATTFNVGGVLSTDAKVEMMCRFGDVHFIYTSTNYLHTLTEAFRRHGISPRERFPMLRSIYFTAEGSSLEWARTIEEFWGCDLFEGYGSTQATGFAYTGCFPSEPGGARNRAIMHALEWHNLVEIVDPASGEPAAPGEEGEIVLTNLDIQGSPVIRFATGDKARYMPPEACSCGRAWDGIEAGSVGRYDDMMKIRGNNVWPVAVDAAVFANPEIAEYEGRVYVDERGRTGALVRLALKPEYADADGPTRDAVLARVRDGIKAKTNVTMEAIEVPRDELPTFTYKARRWEDSRREGYDRAAREALGEAAKEGDNDRKR